MTAGSTVSRGRTPRLPGDRAHSRRSHTQRRRSFSSRAKAINPIRWGQSLEMYRALRQAGVQVEMVQYPREDHVPLSGAIRDAPSLEPWHGFDVRQRIARFFKAAFAEAGDGK